MKPNKCHTSKSAVYVINYVGAFAMLGIVGTIALIDRGANEAAIAILSGMTGVAIGSLASMLNETQGGGQSEQSAALGQGQMKASMSFEAPAEDDPKKDAQN